MMSNNAMKMQMDAPRTTPQPVRGVMPRAVSQADAFRTMQRANAVKVFGQYMDARKRKDWRMAADLLDRAKRLMGWELS